MLQFQQIMEEIVKSSCHFEKLIEKHLCKQFWNLKQIFQFAWGLNQGLADTCLGIKMHCDSEPHR